MHSNINENIPDSLHLKCWLCKNNYGLMGSTSLKGRNISSGRRQLKEENKLCLTCIPKPRSIKIVSRASYAAKRTAKKNIILICMDHQMTM